MHNLATKNAFYNILLVQIGPIAVLPSRVFGFGLTLRIDFWIISRFPWSAICTWEDGVREGTAASMRWREGDEKARGGGADGREGERCAPGFDLGF
jgi:hypothetical protein